MWANPRGNYGERGHAPCSCGRFRVLNEGAFEAIWKPS